jgi:CMP-N,N'-diacetyllegionaminic acid synthase
LKILSIIPARSGSKSIKNKNVRLIAGKPLMSWSIEHATSSRLINRVIVSTDSIKYAKIARDYNAETPFIRPLEISGDLSTDLEVFSHTLGWLNENEDYIPDICVHLRPTYPIREIDSIDKCIQILLDRKDVDSVRSVATPLETPFKMWFQKSDGLLSPLIKCEINEAYNIPRQQLTSVFIQNACIDVVRTNVIIDKKSMTGDKIYGYVMDNNLDIDNEDQFKIAESVLLKNEGKDK